MPIFQHDHDATVFYTDAGLTTLEDIAALETEFDMIEYVAARPYAREESVPDGFSFMLDFTTTCPRCFVLIKVWLIEWLNAGHKIYIRDGFDKLGILFGETFNMPGKASGVALPFGQHIQSPQTGGAIQRVYPLRPQQNSGSPNIHDDD